MSKQRNNINKYKIYVIEPLFNTSLKVSDNFVLVKLLEQCTV